MPRPLLLLVALLAVAAVVWLAWPGDTGSPDGGPAAIDREEAPRESAPPLTQLRGSEGATTIPVEHRGRGVLLGRVLQGGEGRAADVALHLIESFAGGDPLGMWRGRSFLQRILDGGIAGGRALATTRSAADGTFVFEGLASGAYELRAVADDGSRARAAASIPAEGARVEAVLELPHGGETLKGRVVYEDGRAFEGFVTVSAGADMERIIMTGAGAVVAAVDRDGRFVVGGLAPGPVVVSAVAPGKLRVIWAPITLPHAEECVLTLGADGQTHRGRVLDAANDSPLEGASVTAGSGGPGIGFMLVRAFTDAEGRFQVSVPAGDGGMFVEAEGYAPSTGEFHGASGEEEIRLLRTARVTGRVVEKGTQDGVEGVWVFALPMEGGFSLAFPAAVRTGGAGRFEISSIAPGAVTVFAMGAGFASVGLAEVSPQGYDPLALTLAPGASQEVELQVEPAGRLEGRVRTRDGRAVGGAVLALESPFFGFRLLSQTALFGGGPGTTVAAEDGTFVVDTLIPGASYRLVATAVGSPPWRSDELTVASGETREVEVVLEAARWLTLTVKSSDGSLLPGATVTAADLEGGAEHAVEVPGSWRTDASGTARVGPLPPGPIGVRVEAAEHLALKTWRSVAGGVEKGDLADTVVLERGLSVSGRVVVPEGASPARVSITVHQPDPSRGGWVWEHAGAQPDGTWRVGGLPDGTYEVTAELAWQDERYSATATATAGETDIVLELKGTGSAHKGLLVRIVGPDGEPVAGGTARLYTRSQNSSGTHGRSFSNGEATFEVDPDEEQVWVGAWARSGSGLGDALIGPIPQRDGEVEIRLPRARTIEGRVVEAEGKGVGGVRVSSFVPSPLGENHGGNGDRFALSDEDGRFEIREVGEGSYLLRVKTPPMYAPVEDRTVLGGARDVRFVLRAGLSAAVTVLDWEGKPMAGASVVVQRKVEEGFEGQRSFYFGTGPDGVARLRGLAPGLTYGLEVSGGGGRDDVLPRTIEDWTVADDTVRLARGYVITGRVVDLEGRPLADADVMVGRADDPGSWSGVQVASDGTFRIGPLEDTTYRIRARVGASTPEPGVPGVDDPSQVQVRAGATDVVLRVDPGLALKIRVKPWESGQWHAVQFREQRGQGGSFSHETLDGDGRATLRGCRAGARYDVAVLGLPGGRYVLGRDLAPGGEEIVLEPKQGGTITGRITLPPGVSAENLRVQASVLGFSLGGEVAPDGSYEIQGVPPGAWEVVAYARAGDTWLTGRAPAEAGRSVDVTIAPR